MIEEKAGFDFDGDGQVSSSSDRGSIAGRKTTFEISAMLRRGDSHRGSISCSSEGSRSIDDERIWRAPSVDLSNDPSVDLSVDLVLPASISQAPPSVGCNADSIPAKPGARHVPDLPGRRSDHRTSGSLSRTREMTERKASETLNSPTKGKNLSLARGLIGMTVKGFDKNDLRKLADERMIERAFQNMHMDDEMDFEDQFDSDEDIHAVGVESQSFDDDGRGKGNRQASHIQVEISAGLNINDKQPLPTAAETLACFGKENLNYYDEAIQRSKIEHIRESAICYAASADGTTKAIRVHRSAMEADRMLGVAIAQLSSDNWSARKVAVYDFVDEIILRLKKSKEEGKQEEQDACCEQVHRHLIPVFCDENWWVRKAAIHGIVKVSSENSESQEMLVGKIETCSKFRGRCTACRAAIRMNNIQHSTIPTPDGKREMKKMTEAMLCLLSDDHWMVRQEAMMALQRFAEFRDFRVIAKGVHLLSHPEAKIRQVAVDVLNSFIESDGKHDAISDQIIAQKIVESGILEQELFEALIDNGNGRLSAKELRAGLKDGLQMILSATRVKTFLGPLAHKDLRFEEFSAHVKVHLDAEVAPHAVSNNDFYEETKVMTFFMRQTQREESDKNREAMMVDLINELVTSLPVDYNVVPWVTSALRRALLFERDWICKERLFNCYIKMVALDDPMLPVVLCDLLSGKHNSVKLFTLVVEYAMEVADFLGNSYVSKGEICTFSHEWTETIDGRTKTRIGNTDVKKTSWDICGVIVDKLFAPNDDMQLASAKCLLRFWDRGASTMALQVAAEETLVTIQETSAQLQVMKQDCMKNRKSDAVPLRSHSLNRRPMMKHCKATSMCDEEYASEIQKKIIFVWKLEHEYKNLMEKIHESAKIDRLALNWIKTVRRSASMEIQKIAEVV